jgi:ApbE superfamily uncharacterized protein (UPF0280 family)
VTGGRAQARFIAEGRRLHLQDGPIDLIVAAFGDRDAVSAAYAAAARRFDGLLDELCVELPLLRAPAGRGHGVPKASVARRMHAAVAPFACDSFVTPMAAVAGAVADEILAAMMQAAPLDRAFVNNGGDIALHVATGESLAVGLIDRPDRPGLFGDARIDHVSPVRGVATSGRHGRSFSLGIADAVTILARSAAEADAAATIVANAVDLPDHPAILRKPARDIAADSDLGDIPVTCDVGDLTAAEIMRALDAGAATAARLIESGLIVSAALRLMGETRVASSQNAMSSIAAPFSKDAA